ncbi:MAG TPA: hypothetical protein VKT19_00965 [Steroidobacteraceae bacterium]|nr:hypothetical protein [Steroidobacteraceae bacterium]
MKSALVSCLLLAGFAAAIPAQAAGHLAEVAIVDRDTGQRLEAWYHRGEYWVAGEPGARYAIYIRNRLGERLMAVTSVDGVNVITGQNASWDQAGYVLDPGDDYQITGWRKSDYQVADFSFTAAPASYAARTGRPQNVGVIGVALFREREAVAAFPTPPPSIANAAPEPAPMPPEVARQESAQRQAQSDAAAAPAARSSLAANGFAAPVAGPMIPAPVLPAPSLGTAHGEREYSYVAHTQFTRRQPQPDEIIRIRYDSMANLVAMGIVHPYGYPGQRPSPFPGNDASYVPDPPPF